LDSAQITRIYKGKEHAEVEFTVSCLYSTSIFEKKNVKKLFLILEMLRSLICKSFRLALYLLMMELGKKLPLRLPRPWRQMELFTQILMGVIF